MPSAIRISAFSHHPVAPIRHTPEASQIDRPLLHHHHSPSPTSSSPAHSTATSARMAIPRARQPVAATTAPPPLPPPTHLPEISAGNDPGWQWGNDPHTTDFGRQAFVKPGSSLLGPARLEKEYDSAHNTPYSHDIVQSNATSRGSSLSTVTMPRDHDVNDTTVTTPGDESNNSSRRPSDNRLHGERQLGQRSLAESSQSYDKHLLSRIGGPNTPKRQSLSYATSSVQETAQLAHAETERRSAAQQLKPLSMPEKHTPSTDSPASARWPTSSSAISPGTLTTWPEPRHSTDQSMFAHDDTHEDTSMSNSNIQDRSPRSAHDHLALKAGTKRRASSPPRDGPRDSRSSVSNTPVQGDVYQHRSIQHLPGKDHPASRFHPSHSSISSASSYGPRTGSLSSSLGLPSIASSATSYASGRLSPHAISPLLDTAPAPPKAPAPVQRSIPEHVQAEAATTVSSDSAPHSRNSSMSGIQGVFMCECCPKKPKKFETEEELRLHESEKQYSCAYCPNRFKNKNEAERHQNSLHLRKHSWSCAALPGIEAAFHTSLSSNGLDVCGYCGEEFSNPPQWDVRADHLNHVHKFGECNQSKKFFRADHFRQHLKHSHAGTSGKWTNMLENACMQDEPPPEKRSTTSQIPPKLMVTTSALAGGPTGYD